MPDDTRRRGCGAGAQPCRWRKHGTGPTSPAADCQAAAIRAVLCRTSRYSLISSVYSASSTARRIAPSSPSEESLEQVVQRLSGAPDKHRERVVPVRGHAAQRILPRHPIVISPSPSTNHSIWLHWLRGRSFDVRQGEKQGWPLSRQEESASLTDERPEGRPLTNVALPVGAGQEDRRPPCRSSRRPHARSRRKADLHHPSCRSTAAGGRCVIPTTNWCVSHRVPEGRAGGGAAACRLSGPAMNTRQPQESSPAAAAMFVQRLNAHKGQGCEADAQDFRP
jgi:hypothetical protein